MKTLRQLLAALGISYELPDGVHEINDPRLTATQLSEIHGLLETAFQTKRTEAMPPIATLSEIRTAQDAITAQHTAVSADELAALDVARPVPAPAAPAAVTPDPDPAAPPVDPPVDPAAPPADPADPNAAAPPAANTAIIGLGVTVHEQPPIELAHVAGLQPPEAKLPAATPGAKPKAAFVTASGKVGDLGSPLADISAIGVPLMEAANAMLRLPHGQMEMKTVLASLPAICNTPGFNPDGVLMMEHGAHKNTEIINTYLSDHAKRLIAAKDGGTHTAAAPWCEPFDTIRELPNCVSTEQPVRNSIPFVPMGYGGFQFNSGPSFADLWPAVDIWTAADQAAIDPLDPDTWKRCMQLICPVSLPTVTLDEWLTACVEWQIGIDLNNPERFRLYFALLEAVRIRLSEQYTMGLLDALVMNYKNDNARNLMLGGVPDLVGSIIAMFQGSTYANRTVERAGYTLYLDTCLIETLVVSELRAAHAKTNATPAGIKAYILSAIPQLSNIVEVLDRIPGAYGTVETIGSPKLAATFPADNVAAVSVPDFVTAGRIRVIPTSEAFFFGTGELRTGAKQDFSYARQNRVGWFAEEAFAGTKYGCQPWFALNVTINPRGYYIGAINRQVTAEADPTVATYVADNAAADEPDPNP